jgi:phosphoserine aminotransferase
MYLSHRSPEFLDILACTVQRCRLAMGIPEQYEVLLALLKFEWVNCRHFDQP